MEKIIVGSQIWAATNLDVKFFRNGDQIFEAKTIEDWQNANKNGLPAFCKYENETHKSVVFGNLYNYYAVVDKRNIAPEGWEVPDNNQWENLFEYLGGVNQAGAKMKVAGSEFWHIMNEKSTNQSCFSALPGGERSEYGKFDLINEVGRWWSITEYNDEMAYSLKLNSYYPNAFFGTGKKQYGLSVRCIKSI